MYCWMPVVAGDGTCTGFYGMAFDIYAIDTEPLVIEELQQTSINQPAGRFQVAAVESLPFSPEFFDGIICSAVLHFARNTGHFFAMLDELFRVLKTGGNLFIRTASDIGIEDLVQPIGDGVYQIPDGSTRFLLTRSLLEQIGHRYRFSFLEDFKTVNVADRRCMSTLVLQKDAS
jgi:ubiquinone/menaquinone biosynthesis C-methylase UbiE